MNEISQENDPHTDERNVLKWSSVIENERMTALAGATLLVLFLVELASAINLHTLLAVHVFIGVLLSGPLVVKIGSTGYRFFRYYTKSPAFVHKGPPRMELRILSTLLLVTTIVVIVSGIGLELSRSNHTELFLPFHAISVLLWLPLIAIHVLAHIRQVPRLIAGDLRKQDTEQVQGRVRRLGVNFAALTMGTVVAILMLPVATPWIVYSNTHGSGLPSPLIVGTIVAILVIVVTRPHTWNR